MPFGSIGATKVRSRTTGTRDLMARAGNGDISRQSGVVNRVTCNCGWRSSSHSM